MENPLPESIDDGAISAEMALSYRAKHHFRDILIHHTVKYSVHFRYPDFSLVEWEILQYIREFISTGKMQTIIHEGQTYYWFDYKTMLYGLFHTGIHSIRSLRRHLDVLSAKDAPYKPFINRLVLKRGRECTQMFISPTEVFDEYFLLGVSEAALHAQSYAPDDVSLDPSEADEPLFPDWFPAAWESFQASGVFGTLNQFKPSGEPNAYALNTAKYMTEILDGSFYTKSGRGIKQQHDLTTITLGALIDAIIMMTDNTRDGLRPDSRLLFARRGADPISGALNYWAKQQKPKIVEESAPPTLSPEEFEVLPIGLKKFYGYKETIDGRTISYMGLNDMLERTPSKVFIPNDRRFTVLAVKFHRYLENNVDILSELNGRVVTPKLMLDYYVSYLSAQDPEYATMQFNRDITEMKVGDSQNKNFRAFAIFIFFKKDIYLSVNTGLNKWLKDTRQKNAQLSNYDISKLTWGTDD